MSRPEDRFRAVIIGGGVAGCSIAYHLADKGWETLLLDAASEVKDKGGFGFLDRCRTSQELHKIMGI